MLTIVCTHMTEASKEYTTKVQTDLLSRFLDIAVVPIKAKKCCYGAAIFSTFFFVHVPGTKPRTNEPSIHILR